MHAVTTRSRDAWVLLATIVASSLAFIDGSVVNLALPEIQREFHASAGAITWIVELYTLVVGALMLLGGVLGDRYGRKKIFILGTLLFALGSVACAFAFSIPSMLAARVFQGVGGMLLVPASLAIIGAHFSGDARGRAIAAWSAFGALTSALGPMTGGALIDTLGWRWVFWINVPLALLVLYAAAVHIEESRDNDAPRRLDWSGAALVTLGLGALTYTLIALAGGPQGLTLYAAGIAAVALLAWFVVHETRAANPLVPTAIFSEATFRSVNVATLFLYGALSGLFYELPFVMIQAHGYNAIQTAFATLPIILCIVVLSRFGTALAARIGTRLVLTIGPAVAGCGFFLIGLLEPRASYVAGFFPGILAVGLGMGITVAPLTSAVIAAVKPQHVGAASGINNAVSRIAALLAVAALTAALAAAFNARMQHNLDAMHASTMQRAAATQQADRLGGARYPGAALQNATRDAFEHGFILVATTCAALAFLAAATSLLGIHDAEIRTKQ